MIYIYDGPGVSKHSQSALEKMLQFHYGEKRVRILGSKEVKQGFWRKDATLFAMPGGRDLPYVKALGRSGVDTIKSFVLNGGRYLGICAGAYFAADSIEFEVGTPLEIVEDRHLKLYSGKAKGTLFGKGYSYTSFEHVFDAVVSFGGQKYSVLYSGGCYFDTPSLESGFTTLGKYLDADEKPAIIQGTQGEGKVLLSGVHFEYEAQRIASLPINEGSKKRLVENEQKRKALETHLLTSLME